MRLFLCFILTAQFSFSQGTLQLTKERNNSLNSLILGDWYLTQTDIVDGFNVFTDINKLTISKKVNRRITFTTDSLLTEPDSTLRYYIRNQDYLYTIDYDSVIQVNNLKLWLGKKRKLREIESYEIIKCTTNELVIRSYQFSHNGINHTSLSVVYVYKKSNNSIITNQLTKGKWLACHDEKHSFLDSNDTASFEFSHSLDELTNSKCNNHLDLTFIRKNYDDFVQCSFYNQFIGNLFSMTYSIDNENNLLYLFVDRPLVYNIDLLDNEKLIISLNKEKTNELKNTHNTIYTPLRKSRFE